MGGTLGSDRRISTHCLGPEKDRAFEREIVDLPTTIEFLKSDSHAKRKLIDV
jgi:hypothetical protein